MESKFGLARGSRVRPPVLAGPAATRVSRIGNPEDLAPCMWFTGV